MDARTPDGRAIPMCIADGQPVTTIPIHEIRFLPRALRKENNNQGRLEMDRDAFLHRYLDVAPHMSRQAQQTMCNLIRDGHYYLFPFSREDPTAHIIYKEAACINRWVEDNQAIVIPRENATSLRFDINYVTEGHFVFFYLHYGFHDSLRHFRTACTQREVVPTYRIPGEDRYSPMLETGNPQLPPARNGAINGAVQANPPTNTQQAPMTQEQITTAVNEVYTQLIELVRLRRSLNEPQTAPFATRLGEVVNNIQQYGRQRYNVLIAQEHIRALVSQFIVGSLRAITAAHERRQADTNRFRVFETNFHSMVGATHSLTELPGIQTGMIAVNARLQEMATTVETIQAAIAGNNVENTTDLAASVDGIENDLDTLDRRQAGLAERMDRIMLDQEAAHGERALLLTSLQHVARIFQRIWAGENATPDEVNQVLAILNMGAQG